MKIGYFECFCGAAGDMICAALLDAGIDFEALKEKILSLKLPELKDIRLVEVSRCGIRAKKFEPVIYNDSSSTCHTNHEANNHSHGHGHITAHHHHRNLDDIIKLIKNSNFNEKIKRDAEEIFIKLATAEGKIHSKKINEIHFHEVGAVDSIVDIISACICFNDLALDKLLCSQISLGGGMVHCAHGDMPIPAPATAELVKDMPVVGGPIAKELLTPTGAAILSHYVDEFSLFCPEIKSPLSGYGAGTFDPSELPNVVRFTMGESGSCESSLLQDQLVLLETNIDDATSEEIAGISDSLAAVGALDVHTTPILMKKGRASVRLTILCEPQKREIIFDTLFLSGMTLGVQQNTIQRFSLKRKFELVHTQWGIVRVKLAYYRGKIVSIKAEHDQCLALSNENNVPIGIITAQAENLAYQKTANEV